MYDLRSLLAGYFRANFEVVRILLAEFLGTAFLVALGDGSVAQMVLTKGVLGSFVSVTIAYGLAVAFGVYLAAGASGGHVNPAVTTAFCVLGKTSWLRLPFYWIGQYLGAIVGALIVYGVYIDSLNAYDKGIREVIGINGTAGIFASYPADYLSARGGILDQVFGTAFLMLVIMAVTDARNAEVPKHLVPLLIGLAVTVIGMAYGTNCGFPINPARDLGPRIVTAIAGWGLDTFRVHDYWFWIPFVMPHIGAVVGALIYEFCVGVHWPEEHEITPDPSKAPSMKVVVPVERYENVDAM